MNRQDAFESAVSLLNSAAIEDSQWPRASAEMDRICGTRGSLMAFGEDMPNGRVEIFFAKCFYRGEDRSEWQQEYFQKYYPQDELQPRMRKLPDSKIVHAANLYTEDERRTSISYNVALPRFEMDDSLVVRMDGPSGTRIAWAIANPVDSEGWSSPRVEMLSRLLPHVRQYVRVRYALGESGAFGTTLQALLENTSSGVIRLDRSGCILDMNASAGSLLRRGDGLRDEGGVLRASHPDDDARLQNLLARAIPRYLGPGVSGSLIVRRSSWLPKIVLHVKPVTNREKDYFARDVAALVLVVDPMSKVKVPPGLARSVLGLTPTEAEIAVLLAEGLTLRQIAARSGRGYGTIRTHVSHIFAKLGVSRQIDVVMTVLALSNLPDSGE